MSELYASRDMRLGLLYAPKREHIVCVLKLYPWSPARSKVIWWER